MYPKNQIETYNGVSPTDRGEVEIFDEIIFPEVIRKREINIILALIKKTNPQTVLDFGCGGGWLSKILASRGHKVVGVDISKSLLQNAKKINSQSEFILGDCTRLPFKEKAFDLIAGIAILHHLNINKALFECYSALKVFGNALFMDPNVLNPLMAIGRRILPSEIHTKDERPISFEYLHKELANIGFELESVKYMFPFSFSISYLLGKIKSDLMLRFAQIIAPMIKYSEIIFEKIPLLNKLSGVIVVIAKRS